MFYLQEKKKKKLGKEVESLFLSQPYISENYFFIVSSHATSWKFFSFLFFSHFVLLLLKQV